MSAETLRLLLAEEKGEFSALGRDSMLDFNGASPGKYLGVRGLSPETSTAEMTTSSSGSLTTSSEPWTKKYIKLTEECNSTKHSLFKIKTFKLLVIIHYTNIRTSLDFRLASPFYALPC